MKILLQHYKRELRRTLIFLSIPVLMFAEGPKFFGIIGAVVLIPFLWLGFYAGYNWYEIIALGFGGVIASAIGLILLIEMMLAPWFLLSFALRTSAITLLMLAGRFYPKLNTWLHVFEEY